MRKVLAAFAAAVMLIFVSVTACAMPYGNFNYIINNNKVIITSYTGNEEEVDVPDEIGGYPVTAIESNAFVASGIKTVYLPESVNRIDKGGIRGDIKVVYKTATTAATTQKATTSKATTTAKAVTKPVTASPAPSRVTAGVIPSTTKEATTVPATTQGNTLFDTSVTLDEIEETETLQTVTETEFSVPAYNDKLYSSAKSSDDKTMKAIVIGAVIMLIAAVAVTVIRKKF